MKRLALFLACLSLHAAGNIQQSFQQLGTSNNFVLAANWTGDSVTGSVPATLANVNNQVQGYRIFAVEVAPGSPAPTNNYSVTLTTPAGVDMLAGTGASLSNITASSLQTPSFAPPVNGTVTINITGNSVGGAKGAILIYFAQIAQIHGLIPNGPGFPTNNTFSGTNTFTGPVSTCRFNNIRIVDGTCFTQNAAGINAADADLGAAPGEIWVPSGSTTGSFGAGQITATDAQISIGADHVLKVFGLLVIEANNTKGPILLGSGAGLVCSHNNVTVGGIQEFSNGATMTSMVRLKVQDGSQAFNFVQGCDISTFNGVFTNGAIDFSGFTAWGYIRDNYVNGLTSGWGMFAQDIQSGALGGTSNVQIMNNRVTGSGTAGCILITHSVTVAVSMTGFNIQDLSCTGGGSATNAPIIIQDLSGNTLIRQVALNQIFIPSAVNTQPGIIINQPQQATLRTIDCFFGNPCVKITSGGALSGVTLDNVLALGGNNTLNDALANVTIAGPSLLHYETGGGNTAFSYLPNVSYLKLNGLTPASATGTGFGTGPTFALDAGSTNNGGTITVTAGTTPAATGTLTLNFNTTQTNFGSNAPSCVFNVSNGGTGAWNPRASIFPNVMSTTSASTNWDDNAINLTAASTYKFNYWCAAK